MATIVVEALVSASVELLLEKIVSGEFKDLFQSTKLDYALLERLRSTLLSLQAVLIDAEQKQITNPAVKKWLVELQDAVFDVEDLFDEINTEALRCKLKAEQKGKRAKVRKFLSSRFKSSYGTINSEMQKLHIKLKDFVEEVHKKLEIAGCEKLKSIVIPADASQQQSLSDISIWGCDELESISFGGRGLGLSIPNLSDLWVWNCKKLCSLLEPMNTLVGLRELRIYDLPNLESIGKDGFPINLRTLSIGSNIGGDLWNARVWESLTCLSGLTIGGGDMVEAVMKMEVGLLPTSLVTLLIVGLGDIESLDGKWLQHLTSLQEIHIYDAPNLKSLPEEGFPSSLSELRIDKCPLLEERWKDKEGKEWSKIAHIPDIWI